VTESRSDGEEIVRRLLDVVPGGMVHVSRDGAVVHANGEALRILGLTYDALTERYITDFARETIHEDGTPFDVADYPAARVLATGEPHGPVTIGLIRPDEETWWAVFRAAPTLDAEGELSGAVVALLDITERKRAEEALRASEQKWRSLAEHLPDFVVIADREARFLSVNRVLPHLTESEVMSSTLYDFLEPSVRESYRREFSEVLESRESRRFETRGQGPGGKLAWYETILVPQLENDEVARVLLVSRDVTERRALLATLAEKERLASLGMVAASVAHEINNPLTYVLANLEYALGERCDDPARLRRALEEALSGARRMQQIVADLRSLGRSSKEELFYVDVPHVIETSLRLAGPEVRRFAQVQLDLTSVPGVLASESRLCQVCINLLVNAAQSFDEATRNDRACEIRVRTRHDEATDRVAIDVQDNGCGIPGDLVDRVFEPFVTTKSEGTGLGLSISRDMVERMGGKIEVDTQVGRGTTVTVWLSTTRVLPASS